MTFELSTLALSDEAIVHLTHPVTEMPLYAPVGKGEDPESKPVQITLKGTASQAYRKAVDAMMKKAAKRGKREPTSDELRDQSVDFLVALSVKIDNLTLEGEPVDNADAFRKLYSDARYEWLKSQANSALGDTSAFLQS